MRKRLGSVMAIVGGLLLLAGSATTAPAAPAARAEAGTRVDLNSATAAELAQLPGIGPSKARAIVEHRTKEPFKTPDDLRKVKGIGDKLYESLREQITVGDAEPGAGRGS